MQVFSGCFTWKLQRFKFTNFNGSCLQVYSGYRFAAAAKDQGKPVAILNIGPTRADKLADLKIDAKCGEVLPNIKLTNSWCSD